MGSEVARRNYNESSDSIRYTDRKYPSDLPSNRIKMSGFISGNLKADTKLFPDLHKKFLLTSQSTSSKNFCSPASFCLHFSFASYRINLLLTPVLSACFPVVQLLSKDVNEISRSFSQYSKATMLSNLKRHFAI